MSGLGAIHLCPTRIHKGIQNHEMRLRGLGAINLCPTHP